MGMKSKSGHFAGSGAGGPSKREGGLRFKLNVQLFAKMPKQRAQIKHIMAERQGHLKDSSKNCALLEKVSKDSKNYKGIDKHGNKVYSKIVKGNEIWVHTRNGTIQNGGSNGRNYKYHKMGGKK